MKSISCGLEYFSMIHNSDNRSFHRTVNALSAFEVRHITCSIARLRCDTRIVYKSKSKPHKGAYVDEG